MGTQEIIEQLVYIKNHLDFVASYDTRLEFDAKVLATCISALQNQERYDPKPLTIAELRNMNDQTVYCLELNTVVRVSARKTGWITIHYPLPIEKECCKAHGLTLYRTKPKEG